MIYKQKKWANKTEFELKEDHFIYYIKDESGSTKRRFDYLALPSEEMTIITDVKHPVFLIFAISFLVVGMAQYLIFLAWKDQVRFSMAFISIIFYALYAKSKTRFLSLPTEDGMVNIIINKDSDEIKDALYSRRNDILLKKFGEINTKKLS